MLSSTWDRELAKDLAQEIEICTGDRAKRSPRCAASLPSRATGNFCRPQKARVKNRRRRAELGRSRDTLLRAREAGSIRRAFPERGRDCSEWRDARENLHTLIIGVLAELRAVRRSRRERPHYVEESRSRLRAERTHAHGRGIDSYDEAFDKALQVFRARAAGFRFLERRPGERAVAAGACVRRRSRGRMGLPVGDRGKVWQRRWPRFWVGCALRPDARGRNTAIAADQLRPRKGHCAGATAAPAGFNKKASHQNWERIGHEENRGRLIPFLKASWMFSVTG